MEELHPNDIVYIRLNTTDRLLYGVYKVEKTSGSTMKTQYAELVLLTAPRKARYFNKTIKMTGFRVALKRDHNTFSLYHDMYDLVKDFCWELDNADHPNLKMINKFKRLYPSLFKIS